MQALDKQLTGGHALHDGALRVPESMHTSTHGGGYGDHSGVAQPSDGRLEQRDRPAPRGAEAMVGPAYDSMYTRM